VAGNDGEADDFGDDDCDDVGSDDEVLRTEYRIKITICNINVSS
jgi:hypothetical protein